MNIRIILVPSKVCFFPSSAFPQVQHSISDWNDTRSIHVIQGRLHCLFIHIQCRSNKSHVYKLGKCQMIKNKMAKLKIKMIKIKMVKIKMIKIKIKW